MIRSRLSKGQAISLYDGFALFFVLFSILFIYLMRVGATEFVTDMWGNWEGQLFAGIILGVIVVGAVGCVAQLVTLARALVRMLGAEYVYDPDYNAEGKYAPRK